MARAEATQSDSPVRWQADVPSKHGYYLAAWRRGNSLTVSELWFNPDAKPPWWFTRGYTGVSPGGGGGAVRSEVVAWMPMPDPPGGRMA
jgi:hypothetical protein